ncbi:tetratricopeptide repeat protein [Corallococcus sp. CA053C]|uniref:tetratricopeptide repeat protein n=1 Tax=Corallococcus sp. CA053C TaxID=2316732 RepID=UPI001F25FE47|nr:tetratricopeptide repeat protein [Corallococcus sp. CA053C]
MKTLLVLPSSRMLGGLLGLCLMGVGPAFGQAGGASKSPVTHGSYFEAALAETARLYDDLEYEQALAAVTRAKRLAREDGERASAAIFEGIVLADLGRREEALASFRAGLMRAPEAPLPVKVSPKVESDFESVRKEVQRDRPALARPVPQDAPVQPTVEVPPSVTPPTVVATAPEPAPGVDLKAGVRESSRKVPTLSWVLLGTGVAAGGVGTVFGLQSRGNVNSAREAELTSDVNGHLEDARGQARVANVLIGTAVAAAAGAVTAYFLNGGPAQTSKVTP